MNIKNLFSRTSFKKSDLGSPTHDKEYLRFHKWCESVYHKEGFGTYEEDFQFEVKGHPHPTHVKIDVVNDDGDQAYYIYFYQDGKLYYRKADVDLLHYLSYYKLCEWLEPTKIPAEQVQSELQKWFENARDNYEDAFTSDYWEFNPEGKTWRCRLKLQYSEIDGNSIIQIYSTRIKINTLNPIDRHYSLFYYHKGEFVVPTVEEVKEFFY